VPGRAAHQATVAGESHNTRRPHIAWLDNMRECVSERGSYDHTREQGMSSCIVESNRALGPVVYY